MIRELRKQVHKPTLAIIAIELFNASVPGNERPGWCVLKVAADEIKQPNALILNDDLCHRARSDALVKLLNMAHTFADDISHTSID